MEASAHSPLLATLADSLVLGAVLERLREAVGSYTLLDHWQQGEFHHDVIVRVPGAKALPGEFLVISTNCNGGVKEVLCFDHLPSRGALWHARCPDNPEFRGELPSILGCARTCHWFDPCALLTDDARSEYREEYRTRQTGGGWILKE